MPTTSERYLTEVRVRWSDLDAFGHVNNARTLTLLEEARVDWLFTEASKQGAPRLTDGIVVSHVEATYRRPIGFGAKVSVSMGITQLGAARATVDYVLEADGELAVTASTTLVPVNPDTFKPRRWDDAERAFLTTYLTAPQVAGARRKSHQLGLAGNESGT